MQKTRGLLGLFVLCACLLVKPVSAVELDAETEAAYKQGLIDWDRADMTTAMISLKKASDGGHAAGQALYAYLLDLADNDEEAAVYYRKAADQGDIDGMFGLAGLYASGDIGQKNFIEARHFYEMAAEKNHDQSIFALALAYMDGGLGLTESDKTSPAALKYLQAAEKHNHLPSILRLIPVYKNGEMGAPVDMAEALRLQAKLEKIMGIDPNAPKKRRRR